MNELDLTQGEAVARIGHALTVAGDIAGYDVFMGIVARVSQAESALSAMTTQRDVLQEKLESLQAAHGLVVEQLQFERGRVRELEAEVERLQDQCDTWRDAAERADEALEETR